MPVTRAEIHKQIPDPVAAVDGYRLWARTYDEDPNPLLALEMRVLGSKLSDAGNKVFADIACGTGRWMAHAAAKGARVFGADLVPEMLAFACRKPGIAGRLVQADACSLPFTDGFADIVLCSFALGYVSDLACMVQELGRITKRGGIVITSDLHPRALDAGWRRTFRCGDSLFEIESHAYTWEQLNHAGRRASLELRDVLQPHFGEPEFAIMRRANKIEQIEEMSKIPAILALEWARQ